MIEGRTATRPIGLAAQTVTGLTPARTVEVAAAAGFDMVGLTVDPATWSDTDTRAVRAALAGSGLVALDAEVIRIRSGFEADFARLLDIAGVIGIRHVIVVSFAEQRDVTRDTLARIAAHAATVNIRPVLEFGAFTRVPTLQAAVDLASEAGVGVLADPMHLHRSGGVPADLIRLSPWLLPYAQLCDAGPALAYADAADLLFEARESRHDIGEGVLPLADFVAALPSGTPLMNEVRSRALADRIGDPAALATHYARTMRYWLRENDRCG